MAEEWYKKQIGPLPLGVWAIVIAAGLGVSYYFYRQQESKPRASPEGPTQVEDVSGYPGVGMGAAGWTYVPPETPEESKPAEIESNAEWQRKAIEEMIARDYPPGLVDKAVRNYVAGKNLPQDQQALINIVLRVMGPPPEPLPPPFENGDQNGNGSNRDGQWQSGGEHSGGYHDPSRYDRIVITNSRQYSTLNKIAADVYGNPSRWYYILEHNRDVLPAAEWPSNPSSHSKPLPIGQRLRIPDVAKPGWRGLDFGKAR